MEGGRGGLLPEASVLSLAGGQTSCSLKLAGRSGQLAGGRGTWPGSLGIKIF